MKLPPLQSFEDGSIKGLRSNRSRELILHIFDGGTPRVALRQAMRTIMNNCLLDISALKTAVEEACGMKSFTFESLLSGAYRPPAKKLEIIYDCLLKIIAEHNGDVDLRPSEFHILVLHQRRLWLAKQIEQYEAESVRRQLESRLPLANAYRIFCQTRHQTANPNNPAYVNNDTDPGEHSLGSGEFVV